MRIAAASGVVHRRLVGGTAQGSGAGLEVNLGPGPEFPL